MSPALGLPLYSQTWLLLPFKVAVAEGGVSNLHRGWSSAGWHLVLWMVSAMRVQGRPLL